MPLEPPSLPDPGLPLRRRCRPRRPGAGAPPAAWLRRPVVAAVLLAAVLQTVWAVFLAANGGDMAAQYAWQQFTASHPGSAYNLSWYGGMHPASYSVLTPYLMAWLGVRTTAVVAGTLSAAVFARLLTRSGLTRPILPALCGALALSCDTVSGRITFSVGVLFGLAATLAAYENRGTRLSRALAAGTLSVLATLSSPVAGLFVLVVAVASFLTKRRGPGIALAVGPPLVVGATSVLFPFYGVQPFSVSSAVPPLVTALPLALFAPKPWRAVRIGVCAYLLGILLTLAVPSPIGSNVVRLSLLFAGALLLAAARTSAGWRALTLYLAFTTALTWQVVMPAGDVSATTPAAGWAAHSRPLVAELSRLGADRGRVEAVPARTHWEAAGLAPYVDLARGWNRQVDVERNPLFYHGTLDASTYHAWLRTWAAGYVVLPNTTLDGAAVAEGRIVAAGQPWLRQVWHDRFWHLYRVTDAVPLVSAPAQVLRAGADELSVRMPRAGSVLVRVAWSPWLSVAPSAAAGAAPAGCVQQDGTWARLTVARPGVFRIATDYLWGRESGCAG